MERRLLGNSTLAISPVGLGAWAIGGSDWRLGWGPQPDGASMATIRRALDRGINWIDTAAVYGLGRSETIIARTLRDVPVADRPYIFTKGSLVWDELGNVSCSFRRASIRRQAEASLRRLDVDAIDLYQIDLPCKLSPWQCEGGSLEEAWGTLADLQREGKVRFLGLAHAGAAQLSRLRHIAPVTSLQTSYSLLHRDPEASVLPYCRHHGIGVLASSPMASGLLTGTMTPDRLRRLPHNDWRRESLAFQEAALVTAPRFVERLRLVGAARGAMPGAVAVAWTLHHGAVTAAVAGARRPDQIDEVAAAMSLQLTADEIDDLSFAEVTVRRR